MQITGITQTQMHYIVNTLNATKYAANPIVIENMRDLSNSGKRISVKLGMTDSRGPGSRRSASGRHGKYCSYFTFWDVYAGAFHNGATRIASGFAKFNPDNFESLAEEGLNQNIGSMVYPCYWEETSVDLAFDEERFDWSRTPRYSAF